MEKFDKYRFYLEAVQSPEADAEFIRKILGPKVKKHEKITLREDFCGTFALCCAWAEMGEKFHAVGIDLDPEPLLYGRLNHLLPSSEKVRGRVQYVQCPIEEYSGDGFMVICALNFSYFIYQTRADLLKYFKSCYESLDKDGVFIVDCFGGPSYEIPDEERTYLRPLRAHYCWELQSFDPLTRLARFAIHFEPKTGKRQKNVFVYDWRIWSPREIDDCLQEVGFKTVTWYGEGTTRSGSGDGDFRPIKDCEPCESWVFYAVASK